MKKLVGKKIIEYFLIILLAIILAFNYIVFIVNNKFAPSGINGIATMIQYKLGFSIGYFSLIVNIPLSIIAFFKVNKEFAVKSFLFTLVYSIAYIILQRFDLHNIQYDAYGIDVILPVLAASIVSGFVYGMSFKQNASTGGTDIIAKLIGKKYPQFNFTWIIFAINVIVASISIFIYKSDSGGLEWKPVVLSIIYSYVSSNVANRIFTTTRTAVKFEIITNHGEEISQELINRLHHTVTINKVKGVYSNTEKDHLVCLVNKHQIHEFQDILHKYPDTFAYLSNINDIYGNFKQIRK